MTYLSSHEDLMKCFIHIREAETYLKVEMEAIGIPGAGASIWWGGGRTLMVTLRASKKVFLHPSGRRLYESTSGPYREWPLKTIAEVGEWLKSKSKAA